MLATSSPYAKTTISSGVVLDNLTLVMLKEAQRRAGFSFPIVQGSFRTSVSASAGTHAKGGTFDSSVRGWSTTKIRFGVKCLRMAGFAAWGRMPEEGPWVAHIHAVACGHKNLADSAARQVTSYKNGRNGLRTDAPDTYPRVPSYYYSDAYLRQYTNPYAGIPLVYVDYSRISWISQTYSKTQVAVKGSDQSAPDIKRVQAALKEIGVYTGPVDGIWGRGTHLGMKSWNYRCGMRPAYGTTRRANVERLGMVTKNFRVKD